MGQVLASSQSPCPICGIPIPDDKLEVHANFCLGTHFSATATKTSTSSPDKRKQTEELENDSAQDKLTNTRPLKKIREDNKQNREGEPNQKVIKKESHILPEISKTGILRNKQQWCIV